MFIVFIVHWLMSTDTTFDLKIVSVNVKIKKWNLYEYNKVLPLILRSSQKVWMT